MRTEFKDLNRGDIFMLGSDIVELTGYAKNGRLRVRHTRTEKPMSWTINPDPSDTVYLFTGRA